MPRTASRLDFPYRDVVKYGLQYLDSISLMSPKSGASNSLLKNTLLANVIDMGIPTSKVNKNRE